MNQAERLSTNLKEARKAAGMTQDAASALTGMPKSVISRYETRAIEGPSVFAIAALASAYGVTVDALLNGGEFQQAGCMIRVESPAVAAAIRQLLRVV